MNAGRIVECGATLDAVGSRDFLELVRGWRPRKAARPRRNPWAIRSSC